ncbi:MAG TPA: hypothetical protein VMF67_13480 [Rhizomicrobium sp.]|nr:hypothetical protein [Rhizomicrobium sp.]
MNKIPVGKVISESVNFVIQKYFPVLGVVWLPMLISLLFTWFVMFPHFMADAAAAGGPHPKGPPLIGFAMELVQLAFMAVISVGVTKEALGLREGPRFVYLSVGVAELRVFGGYILLAVLTIVLCIGLAIIIGLGVAIVAGASRATAAADPVAMSRMTAITMPFVLFGMLLPLLYFWIRLSSFLSAVAVRAGQREMLVSAISKLKYAPLFFLPFAPILNGLVIAPGAFAYRARAPSATDAAATFD